MLSNEVGWKSTRSLDAPTLLEMPVTFPRTLDGEAAHAVAAVRSTLDLPRVLARGKFLFAGDEKLWVRGVTYGTFRPDADGHEYPDRRTVDSDFASMASHGFNTVRVYTMPPVWLLDIAARQGLRVLVSLAAERHVGYLADSDRLPAEVTGQWKTRLREVARHPALLAYSLGNEIPAPMVRWLGPKRVERYLERVFDLVRDEDSDGLVTYVNYPTAEYLRLPFLDLVCFNVYLETPQTFDAYLGRLQNVAGNRPLLMSEIGMDCMRNSEAIQARMLDWQIRTSFDAGCAGAFVYAWTDEWHRGGEDVYDWAFGLTDREREPKPALSAVRQAFAQSTFDDDGQALHEHDSDRWPRVSVVVCSYNGSARIRDCCVALGTLVYPDFEVIVVDDGSTDGTGAIAESFGFHVIRTPNRGLSHARNVGLEAASGDIIAYIDDDAYPDPHWLHYLAVAFRSSNFVAVGGPNLIPPEDGAIAQCVAISPGGPMHVLVSDREAEHIPGCNMAFRRDVLAEIGGFDVQFRVAGDDVDVCWRLQADGGTIGFSHAAVVWHHRRNSIRAYWKQQKGYGEAEALLEAKWPDKYNLAGHAMWSGRIYDDSVVGLPFGSGWRIYHGVWGSAPFQFAFPRSLGWIVRLPELPEWHLLTLGLVLMVLLGFSWAPLLWTAPLLLVTLSLSLVRGILGARAARRSLPSSSLVWRAQLRLLTAFLHVSQPIARLYGRLRHGLAPWRHRGQLGFALPRTRMVKNWTSVWRSADVRLQTIQGLLRLARHFVIVGGECDSWDLEVRGGFLGGARLLCAVEEHGAGCQTVRYRLWPHVSCVSLVLGVALGLLAVAAGFDGAWQAAAGLGGSAILLVYRVLVESATSISALLAAAEER